MGDIVTIIREEVAFVHAPLKFLKFLLGLNSSHILIDCAKLEPKIPATLCIGKGSGNILKELVVDMCLLPREVHPRGYHDMISAVMVRVVSKARHIDIRVVMNVQVLIEELLLYLLL